MRINILHLRSFYAIATEGNINQDARRLSVSQSTLSKQLKALEERHKVALFSNRNPPLRLTEAGETLFRQTKLLFEHIDTIETSLDQSLPEGRLSVRIASDTPPLAARIAHELVSHFGHISLQIRIENARDTFELLRVGQADLAIVTDPPIHPQFKYVPAFEDNLVAALPLSHPASAQSHYDIEGIQSDILLTREYTSRTRSAVERMLLDHDLVPQKEYQLHTRETIREAIALGMGISFFFSLECPPDERICYRPIRIKTAVPAIMAYLIFSNEQKNHVAIKKSAAFVDSLMNKVTDI